MEALWNFREPKKCFTFWAIFIAVPILVNVLIWKSWALPATARLRAGEEIQKMTVLKPKLEALLTQTHQLFGGWEKSVFTQDDPSRAMQVIQRLGTLSRVDIKEIRSKGQKFSEKKAPSRKMPLCTDQSLNRTSLTRDRVLSGVVMVNSLGAPALPERGIQAASRHAAAVFCGCAVACAS